MTGSLPEVDGDDDGDDDNDVDDVEQDLRRRRLHLDVIFNPEEEKENENLEKFLIGRQRPVLKRG